MTDLRILDLKTELGCIISATGYKYCVTQCLKKMVYRKVAFRRVRESDNNLLRFSRESSQETRGAFATAHFHLDPSFMAGGQRGGMCVAVNFISSVVSWSAG